MSGQIVITRFDAFPAVSHFFITRSPARAHTKKNERFHLSGKVHSFSITFYMGPTEYNYQLKHWCLLILTRQDYFNFYTRFITIDVFRSAAPGQ